MEEVAAQDCDGDGRKTTCGDGHENQAVDLQWSDYSKIYNDLDFT